MPFFKSLREDAGVRHILELNKPAGRALIELHENVSGLNECQYCFGVHTQTAAAFGVAEDELRKMLFDLDDARIEPRMRPLLEYARRLTLSPHQIVQADADAVFAAGWSERALHDAILTTCLFNFMNRLLEGHGCKGNAQIFRDRGLALAESGYAPLLKSLQEK
jgi:uncharacterized peroxidase-related enzyme